MPTEHLHFPRCVKCKNCHFYVFVESKQTLNVVSAHRTTLRARVTLTFDLSTSEFYHQTEMRAKIFHRKKINNVDRVHPCKLPLIIMEAPKIFFGR